MLEAGEGGCVNASVRQHGLVKSLKAAVIARVVMIGTSPRTQGGVSAVVSVYAGAGLFRASGSSIPVHALRRQRGAQVCDGLVSVAAVLCLASGGQGATAACARRVRPQFLAQVHVHCAYLSLAHCRWFCIGTGGIRFLLCAQYGLAAAPYRLDLLPMQPGDCIVGPVARNVERVVSPGTRGDHSQPGDGACANPLTWPMCRARRSLWAGSMRPRASRTSSRPCRPCLPACPTARWSLAGSGEVEHYRALAAQLGVRRCSAVSGLGGRSAQSRLAGVSRRVRVAVACRGHADVDPGSHGRWFASGGHKGRRYPAGRARRYRWHPLPGQGPVRRWQVP